MLNVKLSGSREGFSGKLAGVQWVEGKAIIPAISQKLSRGYGVVEDTGEEPKVVISTPVAEQKTTVNTEQNDAIVQPLFYDEEGVGGTTEQETVTIDISTIDPEAVTETIEEAAAELAKVVEEKKAEIKDEAAKEEQDVQEPTLTKSDLKVYGEDIKNYGAWVGYVKELTGVAPKNKENSFEIMSKFAEGLPD